jgi:hypothetical protein
LYRLHERLDDQDADLEEIKNDGKEIRAQAIRTNGRVTALETQRDTALKLLAGAAVVLGLWFSYLQTRSPGEASVLSAPKERMIRR